MKQITIKQVSQQKLVYEAPKINIIQFSNLDIITTSGNFDNNQGEWDPQTIDDEFAS